MFRLCYGSVKSPRQTVRYVPFPAVFLLKRHKTERKHEPNSKLSSPLLTLRVRLHGDFVLCCLALGFLDELVTDVAHGLD
jgi:hypothetical protein